MKQHLVRCMYAAASLLALPAVAFAQSQAYTNSTVNVRAGPASDYPVVTQLPGGVPVSVMGCISNYQWCDVAASEPARLGLCGATQLSLSGQQCAGDELRHGDRPADRDVLDRHLLGQLLSRPAVVRPAIPLGASSAAATAETRCRTATRWASARRSAAGECGWTSAGGQPPGQWGRTSTGRSAAGECRWTATGRPAGECGWPSTGRAATG